MNVSCPECQSVFRVDPAKVVGTNLRARCSVCGGVIAVGASVHWTDDFSPVPAAADAGQAMVAAEPAPNAGRTVSNAAPGTTSAEVTPVSSPAVTPLFAPVVQSLSAASPAAAPTARAVTPAFGAPASPVPTIPPTADASHPATPFGAPEPLAPVVPVVPAPSLTTQAPEVRPQPPTRIPPFQPSRPTPAMPSAAVSPGALTMSARGTPAGGIGPTAPLSPRPATLGGAAQSSQPVHPSQPAPPAPFPAPRASASESFAPPLASAQGSPHPYAPAVPARVPTPSAPGAIGSPASIAPAAGVPPARKPINPFLANDPNQKARRLARALVSDMVAYHPRKRDEGVRNDSLRQLFREEIKKSYEEYVEQVGREFAESTSHFQDALNDVLAGGKKIF